MFFGISAYFHDSSVALLDEKGNLIDFKKEEWLSRVKGDKSFPRLALSEICEIHNISPEKIKAICFYEKPMKAWLSILKYSILNNSLTNEVTRNYFKNIWKSSISFAHDLSKFTKFKKNKIFYCDHHLSHTLSGLFYKEKYPYVSVVVDGFGDSACTSIHHVKSQNEIINSWSSDYPHSLGLFYSAITDYLGFAINEGEYKVMGLAAYGKPVFFDELKKTIYFKNGNLFLDTNFYDFDKSIQKSYSEKLTEIFNINPRESNLPLEVGSSTFQKYADIASSAQSIVEENLKEIFTHANQITGEKNFIFSGGVAMNSLAIHKLTKLDFIDELFVPPSPGDSGAAIGAAYYGFLKNSKETHLDNFKISSSSILCPGKIKDPSEEDFFLIGYDLIATYPDAISKTAELIVSNNIVATCYSNIETGPRALGHRSLICNAHSENTVKKINSAVKKRSSFRPVAPAILEEYASSFFKLSRKIYDSYFYMGAVCETLNEKKNEIKAVVHKDGTARVQIVKPDQLLGKILTLCKDHNIYLLANTSFNVSSDPMVYSKEDAYLSAERMNVKYLLTEKGLYSKKIPI